MARNEKEGTRPWIKVSTEPIVMTRKPQKMKEWYLLPIADTNLGQRLEGMVVFSTTFFCPKKKRITESMRAPTWSVRSSGRAEKIIRAKRRTVQANIAKAPTSRTAKRARLIST